MSKKTFSKTLAILISIFIITGCNKPKPRLQTNNTYKGEIKDYNVKIEEISQLNKLIVYLTSQKQSPKFVKIKGIYYNRNGKFKDIYIKKCNEILYSIIVLNEDNEIIQNPYAEKIKTEDIREIESKLYEAIEDIYNK